jgi:uroporphyrinogen-III synthase
MRLLVTRPEPDNERTAAALRALGHEVMLAPLLRIEAIPDADLGAPPWAAILLTSANGARAVASHPRHGELIVQPVLAVGESTAAAAQLAGFGNVISADGDARDLVRLAASRFAGSQLPMLYLTGEDRTGDLASALAAQGQTVCTVVIYRAAKASGFPPEAREALAQGRIDGVMHFSRRSVENYLECGREIGKPALAPVHYCLSERASEPLRIAGAARILVANRPDEASLLTLAAS